MLSRIIPTLRVEQQKLCYKTFRIIVSYLYLLVNQTKTIYLILIIRPPPPKKTHNAKKKRKKITKQQLESTTKNNENKIKQ